MAWKDTLWPAKFRGVEFEVMSVTRSGQRAIAVNEYPYTAGADLDDLNIRARRVKLKAIVYGDDYEADLFDLITALEAPGVGELIHPVHGGMQVLAESWDDEHEADLVDGAILNLSFIEHSTRELVFSATSAAAKTDAISNEVDTARAVVDDALVRYVGACQVDLSRLSLSGLSLNSLNLSALSLTGFSIPRLTIFKDIFNQAKGALTQLLDTTALRVVLSDLDPFLYPRAYVGDLLGVVDRALQGLPFGGRNILFDSSSGASVVPSSGVGDFYVAAKQLAPAAVLLSPATPVPDAGMLLDAAVAQAHAQAHAACAIAECATIVLAGELDTALLSGAEIEALANVTREGLQVAIDSARASLDGEGRGQASAALQRVAFAVQDAALAVINARPPLVRRASPIGGPARLVAHQLYGDASRATEIARLNALGRSVLIERGEALNVYAA